uniref:Uncharacterized protein n=1 Tax=Ditylenchus dipsaci TaxID=166011 RepID=A0A915EX09_9BILA
MITRSRAAMNRSKWTLNGASIYLEAAKKSLAMGRSEVEEAKSLILVSHCMPRLVCGVLSNKESTAVSSPCGAGGTIKNLTVIKNLTKALENFELWTKQARSCL